MYRIVSLIFVSVGSIGLCDDGDNRAIVSQIATVQANAINRIDSMAFEIVERTVAESGTQERKYRVYWSRTGKFLVDQSDQKLDNSSTVFDRLHPKTLMGGEYRSVEGQQGIPTGRFAFESLESYLSSDPNTFDDRVLVGKDSLNGDDYQVTVRYSAEGLNDLFVTSYYSQKNSFLPVRIVHKKGKTLEESQVWQETLFAYSTVGDLILPKLVVWKRPSTPKEETRFVVTLLHPNIFDDSDKIQTIDDLDPKIWNGGSGKVIPARPQKTTVWRR